MKLQSFCSDSYHQAAASTLTSPGLSQPSRCVPPAPQMTVSTLMSESSQLPSDQPLDQSLLQQLQDKIATKDSGLKGVAQRIATEIERICHKSDRIQASGDVSAWQQSLAQHRILKCLAYYKLGSKRGRVELHSQLSAIVYRHIAPNFAQLSFQGRYILLEDFLQSFYIEVLKAFRRENQLPEDYTPRTRLELAEYMAFGEHYAKRRISLPGCRNQQLIVLRAQAYAKRQPQETSVDMEMAVESPRADDADGQFRSPAMHQIREQMVAEATDPGEGVLRERVIRELMTYLQNQNQPECVNYLTLKLQDFSAAEIDDILGLSSRQRDYLQQRFKYHVEKFAQFHQWELVHQWLEADLDQNFGLSPQAWQQFVDQLDSSQRQLLDLKQTQAQPANNFPSDEEIARHLGCTPKQVKRRWSQLITLAWKYRNQI